MAAHRDDLRAEVEKETGDRDRAVAFAADIAAQGSEAAPDNRLRALLRYAEKLTAAPGEVDVADVEALRQAGLDDRAIHDAAQVAAYFAYINRVADGLGVDPEPE